MAVMDYFNCDIREIVFVIKISNSNQSNILLEFALSLDAYRITISKIPKFIIFLECLPTLAIVFRLLFK